MHPPLREAPERMRWLERADDDFPYYRGKPVKITGIQWGFIVLAVVLGFYTLVKTQAVFPTGIAGFIPPILFVTIPLAALAICAGSAWRAIFRRLRLVDFLWMVLFFVMNYLMTIFLAFTVVKLFAAEANPAGTILETSGNPERILFFLKALIQLLGEEILVVLPFLAILYWLTSKFHLGRNLAIALAALAVSIAFAAVHLPTYQWNYGQAMVALVPVRIVLLLPYILTKNIWVSTGTHVLNDWAIFGLPLLFANGAAGDV